MCYDKEVKNKDKFINMSDNKPSHSIKDVANMDLETLLLNLKIISNLKGDEKLSCAQDNISIDKNSVIQCIRRKMLGDSREHTLTVIESIVNRIFTITDELLEKENSNCRPASDVNIQIDRENPFVDEPTATFQNIVIQLTSAICGLQNLKITYLEDVTTTSKLDLVIGKIQNRINKINKLMRINPK